MLIVAICLHDVQIFKLRHGSMKGTENIREKDFFLERMTKNGRGTKPKMPSDCPCGCLLSERPKKMEENSKGV